MMSDCRDTSLHILMAIDSRFSIVGYSPAYALRMNDSLMQYGLCTMTSTQALCTATNPFSTYYLHILILVVPSVCQVHIITSAQKLPDV